MAGPPCGGDRRRPPIIARGGTFPVMDPRFEFALEQLGPRHWQLLEELARQFLSVEFPELREMALPTGDKGRDGVLWRPDGDATTAIQVPRPDTRREGKGSVR